MRGGRIPALVLFGILILGGPGKLWAQEVLDLEGVSVEGRPQAYDLETGIVSFLGPDGTVRELPLDTLHPESRLRVMTVPEVRKSLGEQGWKVPDDLVLKLGMIGLGIVVAMIFYHFLLYWVAARVVTEQNGFRLHFGAFVKLAAAGFGLGLIYHLLVYREVWSDILSDQAMPEWGTLVVPAHPAIVVTSAVVGVMVRMLLVVGHYDTVGFAKSLWLLVVDAVLQLVGWAILALAITVSASLLVPVLQEGADLETQERWVNEWILRPLGLI